MERDRDSTELWKLGDLSIERHGVEGVTLWLQSLVGPVSITVTLKNGAL